MILTLIIVATVLVYVFFAGTLSRWFYNGRRDRCNSCGPGGLWANDRRCLHDHQTSAFFFGLLWPLTPIFVGYMYGGKLADHLTTSEERAKKRADKAALEHERKLEIINAETKRNLSAARLVEGYTP